ncbi:MAG: hypothetical protein HXS48_28265 [Theionarchaea archaeon]|nr:MAG: hypothetical protein AYK19_11715 [Theionarchaea archaeon DG-70-1]MBU7030861.1 hypothetical protein [Theionarchaea archaeon]
MEKKTVIRIVRILIFISVFLTGFYLISEFSENPGVNLWVDKGCGENYAVRERVKIWFEVITPVSVSDATVTLIHYTSDGKEYYMMEKRTVPINKNTFFMHEVQATPRGRHDLEIFATVVVNGEEITFTNTCHFFVGESSVFYLEPFTMFADFS